MSFDGLDDYLVRERIVNGRDYAWSLWVKLGPENNSFPNSSIFIGQMNETTELSPHIALVKNERGTITVNYSVYTQGYTQSECDLLNDNWHHLVATSSSSGDNHLYCNGKRLGSFNSSGHGQLTDLFVIGGDRRHGPRRPLRYDVDNLRVYNRALPDSQVAQLHEYESTPTELPPVEEPRPIQEWLNDGLVAYYPFDGDAKDYSGNEYHMLEETSLGQDRFGNNSASADLRSPETMKPNSGFYDGIEDFTYNLWVKIRSEEVFYENITLIQESDVVDLGGFQGLMLQIYNGNLEFMIPGGTFWNYVRAPKELLPTEEWKSVTCVRRGVECQIFFDGVLVAENEISPLTSPIGGVVFGGTHDRINSFDGLLDDIRFYDRALSATEVAQLYEYDLINDNNLLVNTPPTAFGQITRLNQNGIGKLSLIASDPEEDVLSYIIVSAPSHGTIKKDNNIVEYIPQSGFIGTDTFTFKVNDGLVDSNTVIVTLHVNAKPIEVTWEILKDSFVYGEVATKSLLSATSDLSGQFLYQIKPLAVGVFERLTEGERLSVGNQIVSLTFTPDDSPQDLVVLEETITVAKAPLIAKANSISIEAGSSFQNLLSISYEGFVLGDRERDLQVAPSFNVINFTPNLAGQFEVQLLGGKDENYSFSYVSGVLEVSAGNDFPNIAFLNPVVNPVNVAEGKEVELHFQLDDVVPVDATVGVSKGGLPFGKTRVSGRSIYFDIESASDSDSGAYTARLSIPKFKSIESAPITLNVIDDMSLGEELLNFRQSDYPMLGAPIINDDNSIVMSTKDGSFYGYITSPINGEIEPAWAYSIGQEILGNILKGEGKYYYTLSDDGTLIKFEQVANSGAEIWSFDTDQQGSLSNGFTNSPSILNDEIVVFGWIDGYVYAVNRQSGDLVWKTDLGSQIFTPVSVHEGKIYTHTWDTYYWVLDSSGQILKKNGISQGLCRQQPSVDEDGTSYLGCDDKYVYAFWSHGEIKWTFKSENIVSGGIVVGDNFIAFIDQMGVLYFLKKNTGALIKKSQLSKVPGSTSHLALGYDGTIVVGSQKGGLFAFAADGEIIWEYNSAPATWSSPSIGRDGKVFFGSDAGNFYVVQGHTSLGMQFPWYKQGGNRLNTGGLWLATQDQDSGGGTGSGERPDLMAGIESGNIVINVVGHDKQRVYKVYTSDDLKSWIEVPGYRPNVNGEIKLPANRSVQFIKVE